MPLEYNRTLLEHFDESVRNLLPLIDPLLISIRRCADVVDQINDLVDRRDREQAALNDLQRSGTPEEISQQRKLVHSLNEKIGQLHSPFSSTEKGIYDFLGKLKPVLSAVPMEPTLLLNIRAEIERLEIWEKARNRDLGMSSSFDDLMTVKQRLGEILDCLGRELENEKTASSSLPNVVAAPAVGQSGRRERRPDIETSRRRIELVDQLTTELATIAQHARKFTTLNELRQRYPDFRLWKQLSEQEQKELLTIPFRAKPYARSLVLREFGIGSSETLKKDRKKLREAAG